jgi:hypothetical protein
LDAQGNAVFSGRVSGGSIDIGNGAFTVNSTGDVSITRGQLNINDRFIVNQSGDVTMSSATITGGELRLGGTPTNPNFHVDNLGNVTIRSGSIAIGGTAGNPAFHVDNTGNLRIGGTAANPNFRVDNQGNVTMTRGSISWGDGGVAAPTPAQVGAIANVANSVLSTHISQNAIQTGHITANAITATQLATNAVTADKILAGAVVADKIDVNRLSAISADMGILTAGEIRGGHISAQTTFNVGNGNFVVDVLGNVSVRGNIQMMGGSITWTSPGISGVNPPSPLQVGAIPNEPNVIFNTHITQNAIQTGHINTNAITSEKINANAVTALKIDVIDLSAISANLGTINSGTINTITLNSCAINSSNLTWGTLGRLHVGPGSGSQLAVFESQQGIQINAMGGGMHLRATGQFWMEGIININIAANGMGGASDHRNLVTLLRRIYDRFSTELGAM